MTTSTSHHNVAAVFLDHEPIESALKELTNAGITEDMISVIGRTDHPIAEGDTPEEAADVQQQMARGAVKGSAVGGAAGGLAGLALFAIPGIGPALGVGAWVTVIGGAAAGATAGAMAGGFRRMWDMTYRDLVSQGRVLVGVATNDRSTAETAYKVLLESHPERLDCFDAAGERVQMS